jgi:hypothetical protein
MFTDYYESLSLDQQQHANKRLKHFNCLGNMEHKLNAQKSLMDKYDL